MNIEEQREECENKVSSIIREYDLDNSNEIYEIVMDKIDSIFDENIDNINFNIMKDFNIEWYIDNIINNYKN